MQKLKQYNSTSLTDWVFALLCAWPLIGLYADGWHHNHLDAHVDSFINPFHIIFYSGFLVVFIFLCAQVYGLYRKGKRGTQIIPVHYCQAFVGAGIFLIGSVLDFSWHYFFGLEGSIDALLSPPHLLLALGGTLTVVSLLSNVLREKSKEVGTTSFPVVLSFAYLFLILIFMTQFLHPYYLPVMGLSNQPSDVFNGQALGVAALLFRSILFFGMILVTLKHFKFPKGGLLLVCFLEAVGISCMRGEYQFIWTGILVGFAAEIIYHYFYPHFGRVLHMRLFAFLLPASFTFLYVATIVYTQGIWWSVHMASGIIFVSGIIGLLMSYLIVSPGELKKLS